MTLSLGVLLRLGVKPLYVHDGSDGSDAQIRVIERTINPPADDRVVSAISSRTAQL